jgi:hypothetical protein
MRKAQYIKFMETNKYEANDLLKYYKDTIHLDRMHICKLLNKINNNDNYNLLGRKDFDNEIIPQLNKLKNFAESKELIVNDYTYNIAHLSEYEYVTYYELILPFIKHQEKRNSLVVNNN